MPTDNAQPDPNAPNQVYDRKVENAEEISKNIDKMLVVGLLTDWKMDWTLSNIKIGTMIQPLIVQILDAHDIKPGAANRPTMRSIRPLVDGELWKHYSALSEEELMKAFQELGLHEPPKKEEAI